MPAIGKCHALWLYLCETSGELKADDFHVFGLTITQGKLKNNVANKYYSTVQ